MFIPAFLDLTPCTQRRYIWHFFGAVNMQKYCHGPVIAPEDYFSYPSDMITPDTERAWAKNCFANQNLPHNEDLDKIRQCPIPERILDVLIAKCGSKSDAAVAIYAQRIPELEEWLCKTLDTLQAETSEKMEALVLVVDIPSFSSVCRARNIPVLYYEFGAFREPTYYNVSYYSFDGVNIHLKLEKLFKEFKKEISQLKSWELFTAKELLALFLVPEKLYLLEQFHESAEYEAGILAESTFFAPTRAVNQKNTLDLIDVATSYFSHDTILIRNHPADPLHLSYNAMQIAIDDSPSAVEFILKCQRIISRTSNSIVEAQLWGKSVYTIDPEPYGFACLSALDGEALQTVDLKFVNFMAFAFYFPMEFTYDVRYMRWRLTCPSWIEIYRKNLAYCLSVHGIPEEVVKKTGKERLQQILDFRQEKSKNVRELVQQIKILENKEARLRAQLDDPNIADVLSLQQTREKIRQIRVAIGAEPPVPHLSALPMIKEESGFWVESTLFWDTGEGFSQQACSREKMICQRGRFVVHFEIPQEIVENVRALRWDPLEGEPIAITVDDTSEIHLQPMNANYNEEGTDFFASKDPMYHLAVKEGKRSVQISGRIRLLSQPEVEWTLCKSSEQKEVLGRQIELLNGRLNATEVQLRAVVDQLEIARTQLKETVAELEKERQPLFQKCMRKLKQRK